MCLTTSKESYLLFAFQTVINNGMDMISYTFSGREKWLGTLKQNGMSFFSAHYILY